MQNTVTQEQIDNLFSKCKIEATKLGTKTTVMVVTLPNGFELCESSSCVDPVNYNQELGESICKERIKNKIWELEGYLLQHRLYASTDHERPNS
jgi:hydroxymethylpyrimidine/phosphomethylpyrimidine kinase